MNRRRPRITFLGMAKGNREALLEGAKACLVDRGFDGTTVRDIAAAAGGVSMAAIGYHFGSREALLTEALVRALEEWGAHAQGASASEEAMSAGAYARLWDRLLATSAENAGLWRASWEVLLRKERDPALAARLADGQEEGRRGVAAWLTGTPEDELDEAMVRSLGSVQMALMSGLVAQRILDPDRAPTGEQIVAGLRLLADRLESG